MIVCKFGGSIIRGKRGVEFIKKVVKENPERKIIVVSAIGKFSKNDEKLTDLLFETYNNKRSKDFDKHFNKVKNKFINFCNSLKLNYKEILSFEKLRAEFQVESIEYIVSRGEYYTAKIIAKYLNYNFLPCENFLVADKFGNIDVIKSKNYLKSYNFTTPSVIPGFYFLSAKNTVKLFNRGGGDVTGSIISYLLNCKAYENYTNVNGILNISPSICSNAETINKMNYYQAYICTKMGASVFANEAIKYLNKGKIKTYVKNAKILNGSYTYIGEKGCFYYLFSYENFNIYSDYKNSKKERLIQAFFKHFMLHKKHLKEVKYYNKKIYYITNNNDGTHKCICLNIFAKLNTKLVYKIKRLCKKSGIIYLREWIHKRFNYNKIYFIGVTNDKFIVELKDILKGLTF